jgi:hypothetical protein
MGKFQEFGHISALIRQRLKMTTAMTC